MMFSQILSGLYPWIKRLFVHLSSFKVNRFPFASLVGMIFLALTVTAAQAQVETPPVPDDAVNAIAREMYCPVCENIPLDVCGTQACQQWRELIREKLSQGRTEEQIKEYFALQYGDRVLAVPPARGLNWLVYVVPPLAIPLGIFLVYRVLRSWRRPTPDAASPAASAPTPVLETPADEYARRLEEELRRRK